MVRGRLPTTLGLSRRARSPVATTHRGRARGLAVRPCGHARATPAAPPRRRCGDNDPVLAAVVSSGKDVCVCVCGAKGISACEEGVGGGGVGLTRESGEGREKNKYTHVRTRTLIQYNSVYNFISI